MRPARGITLALLASIALVLYPTASALAHGEEDEAAEALPARALAQQALAILTQADEPAEAQEKLEAAVASEDQKGVEVASLREALAAAKRNDSETAVEHLNEALSPAEAREPEDEDAAGGGAEEAEHEETELGEKQAPAAGTLEHADEFEPERGTAEWIALAVGFVAALGALTALALVRRGAAR